MCAPFLQVRQCTSKWRKAGASNTILRWIHQGVPVNFLGKPPSAYVGQNPEITPQQLAFWRIQEKQRLLNLGVISKIKQDEQFYVNPVFFHPKKNGGFRLITNQKRFNNFCTSPKVKFDILKLLSRWGVQKGLAFSFDLQDGYWVLEIQKQFRKFFQFSLDGELFQWNCLPFGWNMSVFYFVKTISVFTKYLRYPIKTNQFQFITKNQMQAHIMYKIKIISYLDDFLIVVPLIRAKDAQKISEWVQNTLSQFGLKVNCKKSNFNPTQTIEHLGMIIDLDKGIFTLPIEKLQKVKKLAKQALCELSRRSCKLSIKNIMQLAGTFQACSLAIPSAPTNLRGLYSCLQNRSSKYGYVRVSRQCIKDLEFWSSLSTTNIGAPIQQPTPTEILYIDASDRGWGAKWREKILAGCWSQKQHKLAIHLKELLAIKLTIEQWGKYFQNKAISIGEDNRSVQCVIQARRSKNKFFHAIYMQLEKNLQFYNITLSCIWLPSALNPADAPSRLRQHHSNYYDILYDCFGPFSKEWWHIGTINEKLTFRDTIEPSELWVPTNDEHVWICLDNILNLKQKVTIVLPFWPGNRNVQKYYDQAQDFIYLPKIQQLSSNYIALHYNK